MKSENTVSFLTQYIPSVQASDSCVDQKIVFCTDFLVGFVICDLGKCCLNEKFLCFCLQCNCKEYKIFSKIML